MAITNVDNKRTLKLNLLAFYFFLIILFWNLFCDHHIQLFGIIDDDLYHNFYHHSNYNSKSINNNY